MGLTRRETLLIGGTVLVVGTALSLGVLSPPKPEPSPALPPLPVPRDAASASLPLVAPVESDSLPPSTSSRSPYGRDPWRTCRRDRERTVPRAAVMPLLGARPPDGARFGRMTPERDAGALRGVRLSDVDETTVLLRLGFENGDLVESINGFPMDHLERLRTSTQLDKLTAVIDRRGVSTCIELNLED